MTNEEMQKVLLELKGRLDNLERSDRFFFQKDIQLNEGRSIKTGFTTGATLASSSTQKIGFHGSKAVQASAIADLTATGGDSDGTARTAINSILASLRGKGIIAT